MDWKAGLYSGDASVCPEEALIAFCQDPSRKRAEVFERRRVRDHVPASEVHVARFAKRTAI